MQSQDSVIDGAMQGSLGRIIHEEAISTVFQPIVDIQKGRLFGYEALSRGPFPFNTANMMFETAKGCNLSWDLDRVCRLAALRRIASLPPALREHIFFINVSPNSVTDCRLLEGLTPSALEAFGINLGKIVIEVTETAGIVDYLTFAEHIRHFARQGYRIALDDFGSGNSGLLTLVSVAPHFIKLDRGLVAEIDRHPYKQELIKAIASFATTVGAEIVGEGVERREEISTLIDLGVRFGQGFFIGRPASLADGQLHEITLGVAGSSRVPTRKPVSLLRVYASEVQHDSV